MPNNPNNLLTAACLHDTALRDLIAHLARNGRARARRQAVKALREARAGLLRGLYLGAVREEMEKAS